MSEETLTFGTDVSRLLDIVANALYTNRDVFLRELISNAADACDKLRYESLQNPELVFRKFCFLTFINQCRVRDVKYCASAFKKF